MWKTSLYNLILRGLTLVSKFILMFFMARYLSPEELGVYGLAVVTTAIALYFLGMDFYVFNTREILGRNDSDHLQLIRDQLAFHGVVYIFVLPLLLFVFMAGFLPWKFIGWFYLLVILEHLSQEAHRLFVILGRPLTANVVLFFRSGAWVYAVIGIWFLSDSSCNLTLIWLGWSVGVLISLLVTAYQLRDLPWSRIRFKPVDWSWVKRGIVVALPFLCATISLKGVEYFDRYFIQSNLGEAFVGVYVFYFSIANVIQIFVITGIDQILHPKIITAYQKGQMLEYRALIWKMGISSISVAIIISGFIAAAIYPILAVINKPIYADNLTVLWILLGVSIVVTMRMLPYYALYVRKYDKAILMANVSALAVSITANVLLIPRFGLVGAAGASLLSNITLLIVSICLLKGWDILHGSSQSKYRGSTYSVTAPDSTPHDKVNV